MEFTENLDNFKTKSRKDGLVCFIKKNFVLNEDYIINKVGNNSQRDRGGHNKNIYFLTKSAYNLFINSFKLRQLELTKKSLTHPILIKIETATIGFIYDCLKKHYKIEKQYKINQYYIDLYFLDYKLAIECDETYHENNIVKDQKREKEIINVLNCTFYRFKPEEDNFVMSKVLSDILEILFNN